MSKFQKMSEAEAEVMGIIWLLGGSVSFSAVLSELEDRNKDWKPNTVRTFLVRLVDKGLLASKKQGWANEYTPLVSEAEYKSKEARSFLDAAYDGSAKKFMAALYEGDNLTAEEIEDLKKWFSQR